MVKPHLLLLCSLVILTGRDCLGAEAPTLNAEQVKQVVLFAPKPYFPPRARKEYKTGAGVFLLNINPETGLVESIKIEKTTGLWSFDVSCLKTFVKWRFKPHTVGKLHVPVRFVFADGKLEHPATW
jgi:TonB family protein